MSDAIPDIQEAAIQIQSFAHDAGMEISIETMPNAAFIAGRSTEEFQAFMMRSLLVTLTPQYSLVTMFNRDSPVNFSRWVNDEYPFDRGRWTGDRRPSSVEAGEYWNRAERLQPDGCADADDRCCATGERVRPVGHRLGVEIRQRARLHAAPRPPTHDARPASRPNQRALNEGRCRHAPVLGPRRPGSDRCHPDITSHLPKPSDAGTARCRRGARCPNGSLTEPPNKE